MAKANTPQRNSTAALPPPRVTGPPPGRPRLKLALLIGAVLTLVAVAHWPVLQAAAVSFDDRQYLTENPLVRNPSWANVGRFMTEVLEPSTVPGYYQPLAMISLMVDCALGGGPDNLYPFHRTSLLLHMINTALVIVLVYQLFGRAWTAAIVGLIFGVHPMTVEPIAWVGDRKTVLAACFALGSMVAYVRFTRCRSGPGVAASYLASLTLFVLALLSKPTTTLLPIGLLLLDFWPLQRITALGRWPDMRETVIEKVPFLLVAAGSAVITYLSQARTAVVVSPATGSAWRIPLVLGHNILFYLYKIIWPATLTSHYPVPRPLDPSNLPLVAMAVAGGLLVAALVLSWRRTRALLTGWLFFFVVIFPTMGVIGFTDVIASDKYAYLPGVGLLLILAWVIDAICDRMTAVQAPGIPAKRSQDAGITTRPPGRIPPLVLAAALGLAGLETIRTRSYLATWQDTKTLFEHMLSLAPDEPSIHLTLGMWLVEHGELPEAIIHLRRTIELAPNYSEPHTNLGVALTAQGNFDEAIREYNRSLEIDGHSAITIANLAQALSGAGHPDLAVAQYERALAIRSDIAQIHYNLGATLWQLKRVDEALTHFLAAASLDPSDPMCQNNVAVAMLLKGDYDRAAAYAQRAMQLDPGSAEARLNLGHAFKGGGRIAAAAAEYQQALKLNPSLTAARRAMQALSPDSPLPAPPTSTRP